jgi:hypothetical protein
MPDHSRLFLDDTWIADSAFLTRTWHAPRKYPEPVLQANPAGSDASPVLYGSVLFRDGRFHMWYLNWSRKPRPFACYAVSEDGVHWEKPALGLFAADSGLPPNAFLRSAHAGGLIDDLTVIDDPADPEWPLRILYYDMLGAHREGGIFAARSKDGLRWESLAAGKVLNWGDRFNALPVRQNGTFAVFGRARVPQTKGRSVWRAESDDLLHWSEPEQVLTRDLEDPPDLEIYSLVPFAYEGLLLGGIERMEMAPDKLDTELAWSRDAGRTWSRPRTRPAFLPRGAARSFDDTWTALSASQPIRRDGYLWFYYSGRSGAHNAPYPLNHGGIGLALLRADGFASLRAGEREGWILTPPFVWPGGDLAVNADMRRDLEAHPAYAHGQLVAEALDAEGNAIAGFSRIESTPFAGNSIAGKEAFVRLGWEGGRSLNALAGRTIRLRFFLRDGHLYSFKSVNS